MKSQPQDVAAFGGLAVQRISLHHSHPLYTVYLPAVAGLDPASEAVAARIVAGAPRGGTDSSANAPYLNDGHVVAGAVNEALRNGDLAGEPLMENARDAGEQQLEHLDHAAEIVQRRRELPAEHIPVAGLEMPAAEAFAALDELQETSSSAVRNGDQRHLEPRTAGLAGVILVICITVFEVFSLWVLVFNPTTLPSLAVLVGAIGVFALVNHHLMTLTGRLLRELRQLREQRALAHSRGYTESHLSEIDLEVQS